MDDDAAIEGTSVMPVQILDRSFQGAGLQTRKDHAVLRDGVDSTPRRRYGSSVGFLVRNEQPTMSDAVAATSQGRRAAPRRDRADLHRTLLEILRSTSSHRDIASVVRDLAERLRTVACANRVSVVLHDPARNVMRLFAIAGTDAPRTTTVELPVADSPSGMVWA